MKKNIPFVLCAVMMLAACGQGGNNGSSANALASVTPASENSQAAQSKESDEGGVKAHDGTKVTSTTVNVYMPSPAGLQTKLEQGFEKKYPGIDMVVTSGTTGELTAKIEAEKNNPVCDVLILASWSDGLAALTNYSLLAYQPADSDRLQDAFLESSHKIYGTSASAVGVLYNTANVNKADIEKLDWADFGDSSKWDSTTYPISIPDPSKSGACKDFLAGMWSSMGETAAKALFNSWVANGLTNGGGNKPALQALESGSKDVLIAGVDYNAFSDKKKGQDIDIYYPKGGTVVNPRPAMIMSTGAHNDAAKLVMDYLCSEEANKLVANAYLIPGRKDVACFADRIGMADIKQFSNLDWNTMAANGNDIAAYCVNALSKK